MSLEFIFFFFGKYLFGLNKKKTTTTKNTQPVFLIIPVSPPASKSVHHRQRDNNPQNVNFEDFFYSNVYQTLLQIRESNMF